MGLSKIEALKWTAAFGKGFNSATAPYYGVNVIDVRPENLEALLANVAAQTVLAKQIGAEPQSLSERDNGEFVRVVWIFSYPNGLNSQGTSPMAIWKMRSFFPTWFEFCRLVETYEWSIETELPPSTEN